MVGHRSDKAGVEGSIPSPCTMRVLSRVAGPAS